MHFPFSCIFGMQPSRWQERLLLFKKMASDLGSIEAREFNKEVELGHIAKLMLANKTELQGYKSNFKNVFFPCT